MSKKKVKDKKSLKNWISSIGADTSAPPTPSRVALTSEGSLDAMLYDFRKIYERITTPIKTIFVKLLFMLMLFSFLFWTSSLVIDLVEQVLPGQENAKYFAVALFSGGTLTWLAVFRESTDGIFQTIIALFMVIFDLFGEGLAVAADVYLGGQQLVDTPDYISVAAIWVLIIWTFVNIAAGITFHLVSMKSIISILSKLGQHWTIFLGTAKLLSNMVRSSGDLSDQLAQHYQNNAVGQLISREIGGHQAAVSPIPQFEMETLPPASPSTALDTEEILPPKTPVPESLGQEQPAAMPPNAAPNGSSGKA